MKAGSSDHQVIIIQRVLAWDIPCYWNSNSLLFGGEFPVISRPQNRTENRIIHDPQGLVWPDRASNGPDFPINRSKTGKLPRNREEHRSLRTASRTKQSIPKLSFCLRAHRAANLARDLSGPCVRARRKTRIARPFSHQISVGKRLTASAAALHQATNPSSRSCAIQQICRSASSSCLRFRRVGWRPSMIASTMRGLNRFGP